MWHPKFYLSMAVQAQDPINDEKMNKKSTSFCIRNSYTKSKVSDRWFGVRNCPESRNVPTGGRSHS